MIRLYKEGQGIWSRGLLAGIVGLTGLLAAVRTFQYCEENGYLASQLALGSFTVAWNAIISVLLFVPFVIVGVWLYNHMKLTDFLIDTESELKNKVTWPTRKETFNNSVVVVVTCIILGIWIILADGLFQSIKELIYGI